MSSSIKFNPDHKDDKKFRHFNDIFRQLIKYIIIQHDLVYFPKILASGITAPDWCLYAIGVSFKLQIN